MSETEDTKIEKPKKAKKATKKTTTASKKKKVVIVESPAKAKTINRYLGGDYFVTSSMGHLIDLPRSRMAVDIENNFEPEYILIRGRAKIMNELKKQSAKASEILLAADDDREGESIAWHIKNRLESHVKDVPIKRIVFQEITEHALKEAIETPREIDENKVNAQKARRVLDRVVGYNLSPLLWEKVKRGLSAGRVQSVALKLIVDRENEILEFEPDEYWSLDVRLDAKSKDFLAKLQKYKNDKVSIKNKEEMDMLLESIKGKPYVVESVEVKEKAKNPTAPYTTSKMQQAASSSLNFNSSKTMQVAQMLYEGVDIDGSPVGLITYMRTDSTRVSEYAQEKARDFIKEKYGEEFLPEKPPIYSVKKNAQDAHEAIRPTDITLTPDKIKPYLKRDLYRLYKLIWERFVSSQMTPAKTENTRVVIKAGDAEFSSSATKVVFKGYLKALSISKESDATIALPKLEKGDTLDLIELLPEQHFTSPPPRFTDASLVKTLEESGIGRPSTYAPTIRTLISRHYVVRKARQVVPTELGKLTNELISENFPHLVDAEFTAKMEEELDKVEEQEIEWHDVLNNFYPDFQKTLIAAQENIKNMKNFFDEETDEVCEKCGKPMLKKLGRYGFFIACSGFPECRNTKSISLGTCPKCGGDIMLRRSKRGREFYGCSKYPTCDFLTWDKPTDKPCPKCGGTMVEYKIKGKGIGLKCLKEEECGYTEEIEEN